MALTRPTANQIVSTTVDFSDPLIRLNKAQSGANDKDIGIVFERGSDTNTAFIWDESADQFALIDTTEIGTTSGNVSITSYAGLRLGPLVTAGLSYPTSDGTNGQALITNGSGTISFGSVTASPAGSDTQIQYNSAGALGASANLTFDGTLLTVTSDSTFSSGVQKITVTAGSVGTNTGEVDTLQIFQATGNTDAFQSFHISGDYAVHFGLDGTTNDLFVGGWSLGAVKHKIWHAGNDGTGSGLDADTVDGYNPATASTANTIVLRDANANFSANVITATSTSARYADLAENYLADRLYPIGTVLMVGGEQEVTVAVKDSLPVIGTVSKNPGYLMNSELCGNYVTPVAYIGRVPCRVVGDVKRGDRLSPSDIPGVAQATSSAGFGQSIGVALENYNDTIEGLIEILVGR